MTSRWGYAIGVAVIVLGCALGALQLVPGIGGLVDGLRQLRVPGEAELQLEPGTYTVFHEYRTSYEGTLYSNTNITGLQVSVTGPDGAALPVEAAASGSRYSLGSRFGLSFLQFTVAEPGLYRLAAAYPAGAGGDPAILAVGRDFVGSLVGLILRTVALMLIPALLGAALIVVTFLRRRRLRTASR